MIWEAVQGVAFKLSNMLTIDKRATVTQLRAQMAAVGGGYSAEPAVETSVVQPDYSNTLPISGELGEILPGGGFPRMAVSEIDPCGMLIADTLARASAAGHYVAVVGWPELLLTDVLDHGDVHRVFVIPDGGADPLHTIGVLAEGMDLIIFRSARDWQISPTRVRPLLAKVRAGCAAVVLSGAHIPSPAVRVSATPRAFSGLGPGHGRIRGIDIAITVRSKQQPPRTHTLTLGEDTHHTLQLQHAN